MSFFDSLKTYKKAVVFAVLVLICLGVFFPNLLPAQGQGFWQGLGPGVGGAAWIVLNNPANEAVDWAATIAQNINTLISTIENLTVLGQGSFAFSLIIYIYTIIVSLIGALFLGGAVLSAAIFKIVLGIATSEVFAITRNPVFLSAWSTVKMYANMIIVLELLAAAIMMMLNLKIWGEPKKILVNVIIVALLVNFSIIAIGVIIDVANILIDSLLVRGDFLQLGLMRQITNAWNEIMWPRLSRPDFQLQSMQITLVLAFFFNAIFVIMMFAFLYFSFIFIQRYIMLAILFIISPIPIVLWSFPKTSHYFETWWKHFLEYSFMGVGAAFFLNLSVRILTDAAPRIQRNPGIQNLLDTLINRVPALATYFDVPSSEMMFNVFFLVIIVMGFLIYGLKMTAKTAGPIADMVMAAAAMITVAVVEAIATGGTSLAATGEGLAAGAAKMAATGAGKVTEGLTGSDQLSKKVGDSQILKDKYDTAWKSAAAGVGLQTEQDVKLAQNKEKEHMLEEPRKRMATESDIAKLVAIAEKGGLNGAAATERLAQLGKLDALPDKVKDAIIQNAIDHGVKSDTVATPDSAHLQEGAIKEVMRKNPAWTRDQAIAQVRKEKFARMDDSDISKLNDEDLAKLAAEESAEGAKAMQLAIKRNILDKVADEFGGDKEKLANKISTDSKKYGTTADKDARKIDHEIAAYNDKRVDEILAANIKGVGTDRDKAKEYAVREQLRTNLPSMPDSQLRKMDPDQLTPEIVQEFNTRQINAFQTADEDTRKHLVDIVLPALRGKVAAGGLPKNEENRLKKVIKTIEENIETTII